MFTLYLLLVLQMSCIKNQMILIPKILNSHKQIFTALVGLYHPNSCVYHINSYDSEI